ncbi:MAG: hypothetical protein KF893_16930 [Caldilineaceae bacterium]|nr:hypothetical protein [Caldilineaceae bacterium]
MLEVILLVLIPFLLALLMIKWFTDWGSRTVTRDFEAKIRAAESLINEHRVPDEWLDPYRERLAALQTRNASLQQQERLIASARKECLQRINQLIKVFERGAFVGSQRTSNELVAALQAQRRRLENEDWHFLLLSKETFKAPDRD